MRFAPQTLLGQLEFATELGQALAADVVISYRGSLGLPAQAEALQLRRCGASLTGADRSAAHCPRHRHAGPRNGSPLPFHPA